MKKYLLGLFAVALAIGSFAFTTKADQKSRVFTNYFFDIDTDGDSFISTDWIAVSAATQDCSGSSGNYCNVLLTDTEVETRNFQGQDQVRPTVSDPTLYTRYRVQP